MIIDLVMDKVYWIEDDRYVGPAKYVYTGTYHWFKAPVIVDKHDYYAQDDEFSPTTHHIFIAKRYIPIAVSEIT